ncbi:MAG: RteC domain-containing protein [Culturomica sp.]|jgi:hypothetical protein|nr:RteC domain-containing protein [Culturomica sp.]
MIKFTNNLKETMERNIRTIESEETDVLKRAYLTGRMLEELLGRLKAFIVPYTFENEEEEILFFKEIKPRFFCKLLFCLKVYYIEINKPMGSWELQSAYYTKELDNIADYFHKRLDFYHYYRSGSTHRDNLYFMRGIIDWDEQYIDGFHFERDPAFSSGYDFTVAKIHSYDMLQVYLREQLEHITENKLELADKQRRVDMVIHWTGKKAGLISLLYALDTLGVIDNGDISLRRIQDFAEVHFDVKLGNIARAFNEMRMRQNPTQFIDEMKEALLKRINEADDRNTLGHYVGHSSFSKRR